jgi:hypothetical protein
MKMGGQYMLMDTINGGAPFIVTCTSQTIDHILVTNESDKKTYIPKTQVVDGNESWPLKRIMLEKLPQYIIMETIKA